MFPFSKNFYYLKDFLCFQLFLFLVKEWLKVFRYCVSGLECSKIIHFRHTEITSSLLVTSDIRRRRTTSRDGIKFFCLNAHPFTHSVMYGAGTLPRKRSVTHTEKFIVVKPVEWYTELPVASVPLPKPWMQLYISTNKKTD